MGAFPLRDGAATSKIFRIFDRHRAARLVVTRWGHSPYEMAWLHVPPNQGWGGVIFQSVWAELKIWPGLPPTLRGGPPARFFFRLESVTCKSLKLIPFTSGVPGTAQIKVQLTQTLFWTTIENSTSFTLRDIDDWKFDIFLSSFSYFDGLRPWVNPGRYGWLRHLLHYSC